MGRPREFDAEQALDKALEVFWRQGYEGASLPDLTAAMGINRPSLYAAFGNKQELFLKAVDRYVSGPAGFAGKALEEPTAAGVARRLLLGAVDSLTDRNRPAGCLLVQGALACGEGSETVRDALAERRDAHQAALARRLRRALAEGDLPQGSDPAALARYVTAVAHGLSIQAASGATRKQLKEVAELALRAFPASIAPTDRGYSASTRRRP